MAPIPRLRPYSGPALLSYGFRPFFLFGAIFAALSIVLWMLMFYGALAIDTALAPRDWHIHEMLFGYVPAVIAGFLLTAIPNWTGRLPIQATPLLVLVLVWMAGRVAVAVSGSIGWLAAAVIDVAFLFLLGGAAAREIMAGQNWGNLKVLGVVLVLAAANTAFHVEAHFYGAADYGIRLGIGGVVMLIGIIGGRIVPSFTRNWLARENPGRFPISFDRFDRMVLLVSGISLLLWVFAPLGIVTGAILLVTGALQLLRLSRWAGERTWRDRLVLILHLAYFFVPLGFVFTGLAALDVVPPTAGIHAWTVGAIGTMTLAVMTRATLGHTGRALEASAATHAIYAAVLAAAAARVAAALQPIWTNGLLDAAAFCWAAAFLAYAINYGRFLIRPRTA